MGTPIRNCKVSARRLDLSRRYDIIGGNEKEYEFWAKYRSTSLVGDVEFALMKLNGANMLHLSQDVPEECPPEMLRFNQRPDLVMRAAKRAEREAFAGSRDYSFYFMVFTPSQVSYVGF